MHQTLGLPTPAPEIGVSTTVELPHAGINISETPVISRLGRECYSEVFRYIRDLAIEQIRILNFDDRIADVHDKNGELTAQFISRVLRKVDDKTPEALGVSIKAPVIIVEPGLDGSIISNEHGVVTTSCIPVDPVEIAPGCTLLGFVPVCDASITGVAGFLPYLKNEQGACHIEVNHLGEGSRVASSLLPVEMVSHYLKGVDQSSLLQTLGSHSEALALISSGAGVASKVESA